MCAYNKTLNKDELLT